MQGQFVLLKSKGILDTEITFPPFEDVPNSATTHHVRMHKIPGGYIEALLRTKNIALKLLESF